MGIVKDLSGRRFGKLIVVSLTNERRGRSIVWLCRCDCGTWKNITGRPLVAGLTKSCGCLNSPETRSAREKAKSVALGGRYGEIPARYFRSLQKHAAKKGREFSLGKKDIWDMFLKQNRRCALSGVEIAFPNFVRLRTSQTASLDRIDSSKGYTLDNVQWVHKDINKMKSDLTEQDFVEWCFKVASKRKV
jgi:hypothetical protein